VRQQIEATPSIFEVLRIPVTCSFGVAERPVGSAEEAEAFYARADQRLYAAKHAGRNCVRL
jgi:GGDEF domain-containing protein